MSETQRSFITKHYLMLDSHAAQWTAIALVLGNAASDAWEGFSKTIKDAKEKAEAEAAEAKAKAEAVKFVLDIVSFGAGKFFTKVLPGILASTALEGVERQSAITKNKQMITKMFDSPVAKVANFAGVQAKELALAQIETTQGFAGDFEYEAKEPLKCLEVLHEKVALEEARLKKQTAKLIAISSTRKRLRRDMVLKADQMMKNTFIANYPDPDTIKKDKQNITDALEMGLWRDYVSNLLPVYRMAPLPAGPEEQEVETGAPLIHPSIVERIQFVAGNMHFTPQERKSKRIHSWLKTYFSNWKPPEKLIGKAVLPPGVEIPWNTGPAEIQIDPRYR